MCQLCKVKPPTHILCDYLTNKNSLSTLKKLKCSATLESVPLRQQRCQALPKWLLSICLAAALHWLSCEKGPRNLLKQIKAVFSESRNNRSAPCIQITLKLP